MLLKIQVWNHKWYNSGFDCHVVLCFGEAIIGVLFERFMRFYACYSLMMEKVQTFLGYLAYKFRIRNSSDNHTMLPGRFNLEHLVLRRRDADMCLF